MSAPIYEFTAKTLGGKDKNLAEYNGKILLIVNTASKCGFTPQYEGLEQLYRKYHDKGLEILGFPCNQFGKQEPGNETEIQNFCQANYGVSFPMFSKVDVNGKNAHPLYRYLVTAQPGIFNIKAIKWNFTKFLVDRQGNVIKRYGPTTKPLDLEGDIQRLL
jgi:glutathione peroxidase